MRKIILFLIAVGTINTANSQSASPELICSGGDSFHNSTYLLDWSVGESVIETYGSGAYVLTQGFHQSDYSAVKVEDLRTDIKLSVYPNPATDFITIEFPAFQKQKLTVTLTDQTGKVFVRKQIVNNTEQLDFSSYSCGIYFLTAEFDNQKIKSFKIIKK